MTVRRAAIRAALTAAAALVAVTCRDDRGPVEAIRAPAPAPALSASSGPVTLVGAGNIAKCNATGDDATAALLDGIPGAVFTAGDAAYDNGGVRAIDITGDLSSCDAANKSSDGRCDLAKMGRELAHGLGDVGPVYVWGVQLVGPSLYASDMLNGIWKLAPASLPPD